MGREKERTSTGTFWAAIMPLSDLLDGHLRRINLAAKPTAGVKVVARKECALGLRPELSKEDEVDVLEINFHGLTLIYHLYAHHS